MLAPARDSVEAAAIPATRPSMAEVLTPPARMRVVIAAWRFLRFGRGAGLLADFGVRSASATGLLSVFTVPHPVIFKVRLLASRW